MTDFPISAALNRGCQFWLGGLWRRVKARRAEWAERRKLNEALRDLNAAQLRDIGFARGERPDSGHSKSPAEHPRDGATVIEMTF